MDIVVVNYEAGEERQGQRELLINLYLPDLGAAGTTAGLREAVQVVYGVVALVEHLEQKSDGFFLLLLGGGQKVPQTLSIMVI
jgi:hypothetical protein